MGLTGYTRAMTDTLPDLDPIQVAAVLAEPTRRGLYDFVVARREATGRDEAAAAARDQP